MRKGLLPLFALFGLMLLLARPSAKSRAPESRQRGSGSFHRRSGPLHRRPHGRCQVHHVPGGAGRPGPTASGNVQVDGRQQGLRGIDTKKPLGFYGTVGGLVVDSTAVVLVPVVDEKAFVELLDGMNLNVKKGNDGTFSFTPPNSSFDAYFRFANQYAYMALANKDAIAKDQLLAPGSVLTGKNTAAISISVRLDRIPDTVKQILTQQMELRLTSSWIRRRKEKPKSSTSSGWRC